MKSFKDFTHDKKNKLVAFNGNVFVIGYGSVGQAIVPLLIKHIVKSPKNITVFERGENIDRFKETTKDVAYVKGEILRNNLDSVLSKYLKSGDICVDVSLNISADAIITWCFEHDILYCNTSLERWPDEPDETIPKLSERTLYHTHKVIRELAENYKNHATCAVTHGANPGLVTHITKRALLKLANEKGINTVPNDRDSWAKLMQKLGVKVIHIAERDSQITDEPKEVNVFCNTWSCEGFWAEGRAPAEMGWGTHEESKPENGETQGNSAYLKQPSVSTVFKSWVPSGPYNGMVVQHSESITISEYFTTRDGAFRPSVYYVYQPCDAAIASVWEMRGKELDLQSKTKILKDEIISGKDELGVLLIGDKFAMWHGSRIDIDTARELLPRESATSIQVVASLLGAIVWMIKNPKMGYVEPEELPYDEILKIADRYLGEIVFEHTDWRPNEDKNSLFFKAYDPKNPCSFDHFKVNT